ncbi:hypothetical protein CEXT_578621 [Caerostris extrusa]|uniref:Uncharacterized protein n=1 Tax=Caerostris extrusa TaxID=172846 RepID=A0AAV4SB66_CAEEX|nr:hypothetical protein CEXT_578621 [Caerostris extrusa]
MNPVSIPSIRIFNLLTVKSLHCKVQGDDPVVNDDHYISFLQITLTVHRFPLFLPPDWAWGKKVGHLPSFISVFLEGDSGEEMLLPFIYTLTFSSASSSGNEPVRRGPIFNNLNQIYGTNR